MIAVTSYSSPAAWRNLAGPSAISHGIGERGLAGVGIAGVVAELAASVDLERQELVAGGHIGCGLGQLLVELLPAEVLVGLAVGVGQEVMLRKSSDLRVSLSAGKAPPSTRVLMPSASWQAYSMNL